MSTMSNILAFPFNRQANASAVAVFSDFNEILVSYDHTDVFSDCTIARDPLTDLLPDLNKFFNENQLNVPTPDYEALKGIFTHTRTKGALKECLPTLLAGLISLPDNVAAFYCAKQLGFVDFVIGSLPSFDPDTEFSLIEVAVYYFVSSLHCKVGVPEIASLENVRYVMELLMSLGFAQSLNILTYFIRYVSADWIEKKLCVSEPHCREMQRFIEYVFFNMKILSTRKGCVVAVMEPMINFFSTFMPETFTISGFEHLIAFTCEAVKCGTAYSVNQALELLPKLRRDCYESFFDDFLISSGISEQVAGDFFHKLESRREGATAFLAFVLRKTSPKLRTHFLKSFDLNHVVDTFVYENLKSGNENLIYHSISVIDFIFNAFSLDFFQRWKLIEFIRMNPKVISLSHPKILTRFLVFFENFINTQEPLKIQMNSGAVFGVAEILIFSLVDALPIFDFMMILKIMCSVQTKFEKLKSLNIHNVFCLQMHLDSNSTAKQALKHSLGAFEKKYENNHLGIKVTRIFFNMFEIDK